MLGKINVGQSVYSVLKENSEEKPVSSISSGHAKLSFGRAFPSPTDIYNCSQRANKLSKVRKPVEKQVSLQRAMDRMQKLTEQLISISNG